MALIFKENDSENPGRNNTTTHLITEDFGSANDGSDWESNDRASTVSKENDSTSVLPAVALPHSILKLGSGSPACHRSPSLHHNTRGKLPMPQKTTINRPSPQSVVSVSPLSTTTQPSNLSKTCSNIPLPISTGQFNLSNNNNINKQLTKTILTTSKGKRPPSSIKKPITTMSKKSSNLNTSATNSNNISNNNSNVNKVANKHTLEIQFLNKNKRYIQMKNDILERQKPVVDIYQNLMQIQKQLSEYGKYVLLDDMKLICGNEYFKSLVNPQVGPVIPIEIFKEIKLSHESSNNTFQDICRNLLVRRSNIIDLLESVVKSEIDLEDLSDKIGSLRDEGGQLESSLEAVMQEEKGKFQNNLTNWQETIKNQQIICGDGGGTGSGQYFEQFEIKLKEKEKIIEESIRNKDEQMKKWSDTRAGYEKSIAEQNGMILTLKQQINKLTQDLETEKKMSADIKVRNNANSQSVKQLRSKLTDLESQNKTIEQNNMETQKKLRQTIEQMKLKETQWNKDKEDLDANLKHQANLLQKINAEKKRYENRAGDILNEHSYVVEEIYYYIDILVDGLNNTSVELNELETEHTDLVEKCGKLQNFIKHLNQQDRESFNRVYSCSLTNDKLTGTESSKVMDNYMMEMYKDIHLREIQDKIDELENKEIVYSTMENLQKGKNEAIKEPIQLVAKYKDLMVKTEKNLEQELNSLRLTNISKLQDDINQLKKRQVTIDEENFVCSPTELKYILDCGHLECTKITTKLLESEAKVSKCLDLNKKQAERLKQIINEVKCRENINSILNASRDELLMEKETLKNYTFQMRCSLAQATKQVHFKNQFINELIEKLQAKDKRINELETYIREKDSNFYDSNNQQYKLEKNINVVNGQLQETRKHLNHLTELNKRYEQFFNNYFNSNSSNDMNIGYDIDTKMKNYSYRSISSKSVVESNSFYSQQDNLSSPYRSSSSTDNHSLFNDLIHFNQMIDSKSLIGLSIQSINFIKSRLDQLMNQVHVVDNIDSKLLINNNYKLLPQTQKSLHRKLWFNSNDSNNVENFREQNLCDKNLPKNMINKLMELIVKRHDYLQNEADESYDDFTDLIKFAIFERKKQQK